MAKGGAAPTPPDPYKTAAVEASFNRTDTFSPNGSGVRNGYTDANGNFVAGVAPEGFQSATSYIESASDKSKRELLDPASVALTQRLLADNTGSNMPGPARVRDFSSMADDIFNAGYNRMQPQFDAQNNRMLANLQARGIPVGSEAFGEAYNQQQGSVNDAMIKLAMDAKMAAGGEQSRQFSLDSAQRGGALNELATAMSGGLSPVSQTPSGNQPGVNYSGLVGQQYNAQLSQYNNQQANRSANMSALGSLGGALLMKCSVSAKAITGDLNARGAANAIQNMPLFAWHYREGEAPEGMGQETHVGPMAESFHGLTGLGSPDTISVIDMLGVVTGALKDALQRIDVLEHKMKGGRVH